MRELVRVAVVLAAAASCAAGGRARERRLERLRRVAVVEQDVMVPMRDGVRLATDIVRPKGDARVPVVLLRTPYRKNLGGAGLVAQGYAFAAQDVRGRYHSEGTHRPFLDDLADGHDAVEWLARQPWCNGKVGMTGGSYVGFTQLAAALTNPPHLKCILPTVPPSDFAGRTIFYGGALRMELAQGWLLGQVRTSQRMLRGGVPADELARWKPRATFATWCRHNPLREPGPIALGGPGYEQAWRQIVGNWEDPDHWAEASAAARPEAIRVPVLVQAGFFDIFAQENLDLVLALRERGGSVLSRQHSHLIIGPWVHGIGRPAGELRFPKARQALAGLSQKWHARWLKDQGGDVDDWPAVYAYVMGQDRWLALDTWPPPQARPTRLYLHHGGALSLQPPAGAAEPSAFTYDPENPVPTVGGNNLLLPKGVRDHRKLAQRGDVLAFLTEPLERDYVVAGRLRARLWVATSAPDTDVTAMVLDVRPDGYRANLADGIARLRYRGGRDQPELVQPGQVVAVEIDLWSTAYTFKQGHRVALHVSSSNFPRFDRHFNTAGHPADWTEPRKAENQVYHDPEHRSFVELPLLR
ncbi:MAG: CocE/NonD family hydrolase [bacterium]